MSISTKIRRSLNLKLQRILTMISPELNTRYKFYRLRGSRINLENPKSLDEKISFLKLNVYNKDERIKEYADKYLVRAHIARKGYGEYLNEIYGFFNTYEAIDWGSLPNKFVIKWTNGSGMNYICQNKEEIDHNLLKREIEKWRKSKPYLVSAELQYLNSKAGIVIEKYLGDTEGNLPKDYKVYCFNGVPKCIKVMAERETELAGVFMSIDWELISGIDKYRMLGSVPQIPNNLETMLKIAADLSEEFPFVRMDFFEVGNKLIFGEMTFTPSGGINVDETLIDGLEMGDILDISEYMHK